MNPILIVLASGAGIAGAVLLYLASPQQSWRATGPWPARARGWPGGLCLVISLAALLQLLGALAATFTWFTLLMLVWSVMPFLGAWRARNRKRAAR
nr:hypothetical protein [Pseudoxanthomonas sp.]